MTTALSAFVRSHNASKSSKSAGAGAMGMAMAGLQREETKEENLNEDNKANSL
jgi:hypothetical protein